MEKVTDPHARISVIGGITLTTEDQRANFIFDMLGDDANFKANQERRGPNPSEAPEHFGRGGQADDVIVLRAKYRREHKGIGPDP